MKRPRRGFTLVELLVVICIIGILVGLLFSVVGAVFSTAEETQCQNNLKQLASVVIAYCTNSNGCFPMAGSYLGSDGTYLQRALYLQSANDWLYANVTNTNTLQGTNTDLAGGVLVRSKLIAGHVVASDGRISDPREISARQILYCPTDLKKMVLRTGGMFILVGNQERLCPTSYVINQSITYGDYRWGAPPAQERRSRRISEFDPNDFLFIEESSGYQDLSLPANERELASKFDCASMSPAELGKYALTRRHRGGGYVSCIDGHVEWMSADAFKAGMVKVTGGSDWYKYTTPPILTSDSPDERAAKLNSGRWNPG